MKCIFAFRPFADDIMTDSLAGQLWFGAECLAAGSSIMNKERESDAMRPLAKAVTKSLEKVPIILYFDYDHCEMESEILYQN